MIRGERTVSQCPKCDFDITELDSAIVICPKCGYDFSKTIDSTYDPASLDDASLDAALSKTESADEPVDDPDDDFGQGGISTKDVDQYDPNIDPAMVDPRQSTKSVQAMTEEADIEPSSFSGDGDQPTEQIQYDFIREQYQPTIVADDHGERAADLDIPEREIRGGDFDDGSGGEFDYELIKEVGRGATGIVYSAKQKSLNRDVAIKMLAKQKPVPKQERKTALKEKDIQKFLYESQITARLDHPNIMIVHDLGVTSNETLFYSMKLLEGNEWQSTIKQNSLQKNLEIFDDVCDAMRFAHQNRIIHRDLKPQNVLVGQFGEVQVTDWGLAWDLTKTDDADFTGGGTPCYMAPEMARHYLCQTDAKKLKAKLNWLRDNEHDKTVAEIKEMQKELEELKKEETKWRLLINEQSDVYVLGAILYHVAVGYPPHLFLINEEERSKLGSQFSRVKTRKELEMAAKRAIASYKVGTMEDQIARDALKEIALEAMAFDQEQRTYSVRKLQNRLREFRDLIESIRLSELGSTELEQAAVNKDSYQNLASAQYYYEESLKNWPENKAAVEGRNTTTVKYAERALAKSDYGFGLTLLTEEAIGNLTEQDRAKQVRKELQTRKRRQDNRQRAFWIATAVASLVIIGSFFVVSFAYNTYREAERQVDEADTKVKQADRKIEENTARNQEQMAAAVKENDRKIAAAKSANDAAMAEQRRKSTEENNRLMAQRTEENKRAMEANTRESNRKIRENEERAQRLVDATKKQAELIELQSRTTRFELSQTREAGPTRCFPRQQLRYPRVHRKPRCG